MTSTTLPPTTDAPAVARWAGGLILAGHGVIHGLGVVLLWGLGEPGELSVTEAVPEPGTAAGVVAGALWGVAGLVLMVAGYLLVRRRRLWIRPATAGALISLPLLGLMASQAPVGIAVDLAVLGLAVWLRSKRRGSA